MREILSIVAGSGGVASGVVGCGSSGTSGVGSGSPTSSTGSSSGCDVETMGSVSPPVPAQVTIAAATAAVVPMEEADDEDDDGVIGCIPRLLPETHRSEIEAIVMQLPELARQGLDYPLTVKSFERYQKLLDLYQEQPNLLDSVIPYMVERFVGYVNLPRAGKSVDGCKSSLDDQSLYALRHVQHLAKVRGFKLVVRLLPHEVTYLDRLLLALEAFSTDVAGDFPERNVLMYWLWIVCRNPFDFRKFDAYHAPGYTMTRIMNVARAYLHAEWKSANKSAALVMSECVARTDGVHLLADVLRENLGRIRDSFDASQGSLMLVLAILKRVDRCHLLEHAEEIVAAITPLFPIKTENTLMRKLLIKMAQRVALVVLKPQLATWRYSRGHRRLEDNLTEGSRTSHSKATTMATEVLSSAKSTTVEDIEDESMEVELDEDECPHEMVEWSLDCVLRALSDQDTTVRCSASKGVGRICARLPQALANQVVDSILSRNFHPLAGNSFWHGGCLALAELARRGYLLPEKLRKAFPVIRDALFYEEPMGKHSLGSNVRDAACYVLWAFARAYDAHELSAYVDEVATRLVCAAVFDREVSIRRAASAAFQENVGRQAYFPDGIALVTIVDYFAVGNRRRSYTTVCDEVAAFPRYAHAMILHLIEKKITHWDVNVQALAASSLELLAMRYPQEMAERLDELYRGCCATNPIHRHGYLHAMAHVIRGLHAVDYAVSRELIDKALALPESLKKEAAKIKALGGEHTRKALCHYIATMAQITRLPIGEKEIASWCELLETFSIDDDKRFQLVPHAAMSSFMRGVLTASRARAAAAETYLAQAQKRYVEKIRDAPKESIRVGYCEIVRNLPSSLVSTELFEALCNVVVKLMPSRHDLTWARGRRSAVAALAAAIVSGRADDGVTSDRLPRCFEALFVAMEDYTMNVHGDEGRLVRSAAMDALADVLLSGVSSEEIRASYVLPSVCRMLQQIAEKIGRVREVARTNLLRLLDSPLRQYIPHTEAFGLLFNDTLPQDFLHDQILERLLPLLLVEEYHQCTLLGLLISKGGIGEKTERFASQTIMAYQETISNDDEKVREFLLTVSRILRDNMRQRSKRVGLSVLNALPDVLSRLYAVGADPDNCVGIQSILISLKRVHLAEETKASAPRQRATMQSLCALLNCERSSNTWRKAAEMVSSSLFLSQPTIRRIAAEGLFETLCLADDVDEKVLSLLADSPWLSTNDDEELRSAAEQIRAGLGIEA